MLISVCSEVLWLGKSEVSTTWEVAEVLPATALKEYEDGVQSEAVEEHCKMYGMDQSTFIATTPSSVEQEKKKPRVERPILDNATGYWNVILVCHAFTCIECLRKVLRFFLVTH